MGNLFSKAELATLAALRARFFDGSNVGGGYWQSHEELALYDASLGERIGWKWDAVIAELRERGWRPSARRIVDWGCGSGIAGRRLLAAWDGFESLAVSDVSQTAMEFAAEKARGDFPNVVVHAAPPDEAGARDALLLVSHVINELTPDSRARLLALARDAAEILWVEAGTHADSRALIAVREELRAGFDIIAPCTHAMRCGMLAEENSAHWCHHFARVPARASQDARWAQFGRELGIDMRSLPFSFLALARRGTHSQPSGLARIIGRPQEAKGRMDVLVCDESGVRELMLQKRDAPALFKQLHKGRAPAVHHWSSDGRCIVQRAPGESA